jgi:S-adenosylmethionine hydrolase
VTQTAIITLTTDFGSQDGFVGAMKGVILSVNPRAIIVDITHEIEAQDVFGAAFALRNSCRSFPGGTIHLAVVDPGVGSVRRPLLLHTEKYVFVGPDNGLFSFVVEEGEAVRAIGLTKSKYFLTPVSDTFHGRDIFAPVTAYLSLGVHPDEFGPQLRDYVKISFPKPIVSKSGIEGRIIHSDRFGNLITNIDRGLYDQVCGRGKIRIEVGQEKLCDLSHAYAEVIQGSLLAVFGSFGLLEISMNRGDARKKLGLEHGDPVRVRLIS